jgi:hypothetical protein
LDLGYCPEEIYIELRSQAEEIRRLLNGYIIWLKTQRIGEKEPGATLQTKEIATKYVAIPER